jgi:hypothetical protein
MDELEQLQTAIRRICRIEDEAEGGACDDCGADNVTIYCSGYGAWFCFNCLIENVVSAIEEL